MFVALFLSGTGVPIPEEAAFLLAGYLTESTGGSLGAMIIFAVTGVLLGDTCLFMMARRHGERLLSVWPFRLLFTPDRLARGRAFFSRHGSKTVFCAGFVVGIRAPTFFLSSTMGVRFSHFIFWDSMRTLLTCPVSVWVGYRFGPYAHEIIQPYRAWLLLFLALIIVSFIIREFFRRRRRLHTPLQTGYEIVLRAAGQDQNAAAASLGQRPGRS